MRVRLQRQALLRPPRPAHLQDLGRTTLQLLLEVLGLHVATIATRNSSSFGPSDRSSTPPPQQHHQRNKE
jgi:hypothetical protein